MDHSTAMKWIREILEQLEAEILHSCWRATGVFGGFDEVDNDLDDSERNEAADLVAEALPPRMNVSFDDVLNSAHEDSCIAVVTNKVLVDGVIHELEQANEVEQAESLIVDSKDEFEDVTRNMSAEDILKHWGWRFE